MSAADLRDKTEAELGDELVELRREQFNLRMQAASGESNRHSEHKRVRRDIARVKTVLNEKRSAGEEK